MKMYLDDTLQDADYKRPPTAIELALKKRFKRPVSNISKEKLKDIEAKAVDNKHFEEWVISIIEKFEFKSISHAVNTVRVMIPQYVEPIVPPTIVYGEDD